MGCLTRFLVLSTALVPAALGSLSTPADAHAADVSLSALIAPPPTIDGVINAAEWTDAESLAFVTIPSFGDSHVGTIWVANDSTNLYVAVSISDTSLADRQLLINFDDVHNGLLDVGDDVIAFSATFVSPDLFVSEASQTSLTKALDTFGGGTTDVTVAASGNGSLNQFEFSHPLCSPDVTHDFCLVPGDTVGFNLEYHGTGSIDGWPVAHGPPLLDASGWGDIVVAVPEPSSALLVTSALLMLMLIQRCSRKRRPSCSSAVRFAPALRSPASIIVLILPLGMAFQPPAASAAQITHRIVLNCDVFTDIYLNCDHDTGEVQSEGPVFVHLEDVVINASSAAAAAITYGRVGVLSQSAGSAGGFAQAGIAQAAALGGWSDTITMLPTSPDLFFRTGIARVQLGYSGAVTTTTGGFFAQASSDFLFCFQGGFSNVCINRGTLSESTVDGLGRGPAYGGDPPTGTLEPLVIFTYGVPFPIGMTGAAGTWSGAVSGVLPGTTSNAAASSAFLRTFSWLGFVEVVDDQGNLVTDYRVTSETGIDWSQPVPEPSMRVLLATALAALAGLARTGRRRGRRGVHRLVEDH